MRAYKNASSAPVLLHSDTTDRGKHAQAQLERPCREGVKRALTALESQIEVGSLPSVQQRSST
jgi:hypothetical protein